MAGGLQRLQGVSQVPKLMRNLKAVPLVIADVFRAARRGNSIGEPCYERMIYSTDIVGWVGGASRRGVFPDSTVQFHIVGEGTSPRSLVLGGVRVTYPTEMEVGFSPRFKNMLAHGVEWPLVHIFRFFLSSFREEIFRATGIHRRRNDRLPDISVELTSGRDATSLTARVITNSTHWRIEVSDDRNTPLAFQVGKLVR